MVANEVTVVSCFRLVLPVTVRSPVIPIVLPVMFAKKVASPATVRAPPTVTLPVVVTLANVTFAEVPTS